MAGSLVVNSFEELLSSSFAGDKNAICWERQLRGNFAEIVEKFTHNEGLLVIDLNELKSLDLSEAGKLAREVLISDISLLEAHGAAPVLNLINAYPTDEEAPFFSTDVYSYHVDSSPVPTDTILCTYQGASSEILPNLDAIQKIMIPDIREGLMKMYDIDEKDFEDFAEEHFFNLHYQPKPGAEPVKLGLGNMWRLAVNHPDSKVLPCIHRAPIENGEARLLLIC
jgi:hypothetical protein